MSNYINLYEIMCSYAVKKFGTIKLKAMSWFNIELGMLEDEFLNGLIQLL
jgi:hypothetical protein